MIVFPTCKINIGLSIAGKRDDNFHNIQTVFYPIGLKDALEVIPSHTFQFTCSGIEVGNVASNLCVKAYQLLQKKYPVPPVKMHLHKAIPAGAGLGGGSSNAAATLVMLNNLFQLHIPTPELMKIALDLGSDCPFFILNKPCYATSRGEVLTPIHLQLAAFKLLIINPGIHINTGEAFASIKSYHTTNLKEDINEPIYKWKDLISNDFEPAARKKFPIIDHLLNNLYAHGAIYAALTGTGSTVYGIFSERISFPIPEGCFTAWV